MKKRILALCVISLAWWSSLCVSSDGVAAPSDKVTAYYFHGTFRCPTCQKLEQYSRQAIEANFKEALASGALEFKSINIDEAGNGHYADDYQLYTKSLILSSFKDGKEVQWKNLDKIWEYVGNKERFIDYVKTEVADFLTGAK